MNLSVYVAHVSPQVRPRELRFRLAAGANQWNCCFTVLTVLTGITGIPEPPIHQGIVHFNLPKSVLSVLVRFLWPYLFEFLDFTADLVIQI